MATKRDLASDPNTPADDQSFLRRLGQKGRQIDQANLRALKNAYATTVDIPLRGLRQSVAEFRSGYEGTPPPPQYGAPAPQQPAPRRAAPAPVGTPEDRAEGRQIGRDAQEFLGERKRLAPGVRRWGSKTADPAEVYMTVDRNGNRVYTDDADFAASRSRGRLTRKDMAPGMLASDADRTLNAPEGGFTYAPAGASKALDQYQTRTGGKSRWVNRALSEAQLSDEIAATRAGERPIDKARRSESARMYRLMGMDGAEGEAPDMKTLLAMGRFGLDKDKFAYEQERDKKADATAGATEGRAAARDMIDIMKGVSDGTIDPMFARDQIAGLEGEAGQRAGRSLRRALLQRRLKDEGLWFGLGDEEIANADPSSLRYNRDGSATFVEPDSGIFDWGREVDLTPEEVATYFGSPDDVEAAREDALKIRGRRGF